ncbi:MAG: helix-turn-helix domain-containing protein [Deltaproteobacteria bacterium]|nr:helix-turn-helix domain-containing protein [Deltaproteobacteria bacterium]
MENRYFNIEELSRYLGIKKSTIYSRVGKREIPYYKIGRLIRFRREDIDRWIEGHKREPISFQKKAINLIKRVKNSRLDYEKILKKSIAEVKQENYTSSIRETGPSQGPQEGGQ